MSNEKKAWLFRVFFGDYITQILYRDYFINHEIRIPVIKQPVWLMESKRFFIFSWLMWKKTGIFFGAWQTSPWGVEVWFRFKTPWLGPWPSRLNGLNFLGLPSCKLTVRHGKSTILMVWNPGKMGILMGYVSLPEGTYWVGKISRSNGLFFRVQDGWVSIYKIYKP